MPDYEHSPDEVTQPFPASGHAEDAGPLPHHAATTRILEILDAYAENLRAGRAPSREELLERHPDIAGELERYLASLEFLHGSSATGPPDRLGDFRILREIGRGGMGVVYEAEQISLKRRVALKVLRFGPVADEEAMQRFRREAETVAGLHHTNIVPIFAIGNEGGVHYYAMQLIEGRSLAEVAARGGRESFSPGDAEPIQDGIREKDSRPLPPSDVADWGLQAAEALAHAHQRGVVHRDVKPSNLILDEDGRIWLTDFGLARRQDDVTLSVAGAIMGTPRYMSPEQAAALDKSVDHRTDIYSLGATLYELATGRPIFTAESPHQVLIQILEKDPPRPRQVNPHLPRDLETILLKCLAKQPPERYASARELADDLRAFCEGRPIKARQAGAIERAVRFAKKHRRPIGIAAASAAAAVLLLMVTILGTAAYREAQMGEFALTTRQSQLLAEVLDQHGEPVLPPFPVPMSEPVRLPAGDYELRLSRPGEISETWPLMIEKGDTTRHDVGISDRSLWPPLQFSTNEYPEMQAVTFAGGADLIVTRRTVRDGWNLRTVERIDGKTGKPVWPSPFALDGDSAPEDGRADEWNHLLEPSPVMSIEDDTRLVSGTPDLDGDGTGDLLWTSRTSPSLVAISGADGKLLWWHRGHPSLPEGTPNDVTLAAGVHSTTVGYPAVLDVNQDAVPDAIALFASEGAVYQTATGRRVVAAKQAWLAAIDGKTGQLLWRYVLPSDLVESPYGSEVAERQFHVCSPQVASTPTGPVVLSVAKDLLIALNAQTGQPLWPPHDLEFEPIVQPVLFELGDERDACVLTVSRWPGLDTLLLTALDLSDRSLRWQRKVTLTNSGGTSYVEQFARQWLAGGRLGGITDTSIVLPLAVDHTRQLRQSLDLTSFDRASGAIRWSCRLGYGGMNQPPQIEQCLQGPDLNGDGERELLVRWSGWDASNQAMLSAAAISGADGSMFWLWRHPVATAAGFSDDSNDLVLWQPGADGLPYLLVPVQNGVGGRAATYILSSRTGKLLHVLAEVSAPAVDDLNGDGIMDLHYKQHHSGAVRLNALRGEVPRTWAGLDHWRPAGDFDGDGWSDFVNTAYQEEAIARSGKDGHRLWEASVEHRVKNGIASPPLSRADLNGDGAPDLFAFDRGPARTQQFAGGRAETVSAISGRDGSKLWTAVGFGVGSGSSSGTADGISYDYPIIVPHDLTGDAVAEAIVISVGRPGIAERLSVLDGRNGKILWQAIPRAAPIGGRPSMLDRVVGDLNGDGADDVVLWQPLPSNSYVHSPPQRLVAFSGRDGTELWQESLKLKESAGELGPPLICDIQGDGRPEVVVAFHHAYDREERGYPCQLVALDGRQGEQHWSWDWRGNANVLPPVAADFDGDGRRSICMGIDRSGTVQMVTLNDRGELEGTLPLAPHASLERLWHVWRTADVNADGAEELLYVHQGQLIARRGDAILWQWALPGENSQILDIDATDSVQGAILVVWSGQHVFGISGRDGTPRWRCDVPRGPLFGASTRPEVHLLDVGEPGLPGVLFDYMDHVSYGWRTVVHHPRSTDAEGRFLPPQPTPVQYEPLPDLALVPREPLPWVPQGSTDGIPWWLVPAFYLGGIGSFLMLVGPLWLVIWIVQRQAWHLGWLPAMYGGICWLSPFEVALPSILALVIPVVLVYRALREARYNLWFLAIGYAALALIPLSYVPESMIAPAQSFGQWWWVDELLGERLLLAIITSPGLLFWWAAYRAITTRQWKRLAACISSSVVLAGVAAAVLLWTDRSPSSYSWQGWWSIWFGGVFLTGFCIAVEQGAKMVWVRSRSALQETADAAGG